MQGGMRITAVSRAAAREGAEEGQLLTDARALIPRLVVEQADPVADTIALEKLSRWCGRYTPWVSPCEGGNGSDGIFLDITGCDHLFGGEKKLIQDLLARLASWQITGRAAIADTPGTAWAMARYGGYAWVIVPSKAQKQALSDLPVRALRLDGKKADGLDRLGLKRIQDLYPVARAPLVQRFGSELARRLDQALGLEDEPIVPQAPHVPYRVRRVCVEPVVHFDAILGALGGMAQEMVRTLVRDQKGARRLRLHLFRVDGEVMSLTVGAARPTRDPVHMARLFTEKIGQLKENFDAGFGIEVILLEAPIVEELSPTQLLTESAVQSDKTNLDQLLDRLVNRFGAGRVVQFKAQESSIPERAVMMTPTAEGEDLKEQDWRAKEWREAGRPLMLLPSAELIEVMAEVPEGPPKRFRWRRASYRVSHTKGPERMAPEWWRDQKGDRTRDYYCVEDSDGRRFWLFRDGLYGDKALEPRWYMHGFFP